MNSGSRLLILGFAALAIAATGCSAASGTGAKASSSASHAAAAQPTASSQSESQSQGNQGSAQPTATVHISYAKKDDTLASLSVRQFSGARMLVTHVGSDGQSRSLVRFDGGAPMWEIKSERGMLSLGSRKEYAPGKIKYGKVPKGFTQEVPDNGPPPPLEPDSYYVFKIVRASGATDYEVIRIAADGSLQGYDAEPRAGTSYSLCCNVPDSFFENGSSANSDSSLDLGSGF